MVVLAKVLLWTILTSHFDYKGYEHWALVHHRPLVPVSSFSAVWTAHEKLCGGAMSDIVLNEKNGDLVQVFQGCYIIQHPTINSDFTIGYDDQNILVKKVKWIK